MLYAVPGKKEGAHVGLFLDARIGERLEKFCAANRKTKTAVVEAALLAFLEAPLSEQKRMLFARQDLDMEQEPLPPVGKPAAGRKVG